MSSPEQVTRDSAFERDPYRGGSGACVLYSESAGRAAAGDVRLRGKARSVVRREGGKGCEAGRGRCARKRARTGCARTVASQMQRAVWSGKCRQQRRKQAANLRCRSMNPQCGQLRMTQDDKDGSLRPIRHCAGTNEEIYKNTAAAVTQRGGRRDAR